MQEPTNAVLAEKIDSLREVVDLKFADNDKCHEEVNTHLAKLNGQVIKNGS